MGLTTSQWTRNLLEIGKHITIVNRHHSFPPARRENQPVVSVLPEQMFSLKHGSGYTVLSDRHAKAV